MLSDVPGVTNPATWLSDESHFRSLLERLPVGAYTCDAQGLITYFNQAAVRLWGREPKLNDPEDRFCGSFRLFAPDGMPIRHDRCWMALAMLQDREFSGEEIVIERPDGVRVTALAHANPIHDLFGKVVGGVNVLVDISDRKSGEEARAVLASIVGSSDDAIISKSLDGIVTSWNAGAERIFGYTAEEAIGRSITMIIPPDRLDEEREILASLRRGERVDHYETQRVAKDGRILEISLTSSPIHDSAGNLVGASKVARNITERKESQAALEGLNARLASQLEDIRRLQEMSVRLFTTRDLEPILHEVVRTALAVEGTDIGMLSLWDSEKNALCIGASIGLSEEFLEAWKCIPRGVAACGECFQSRRHTIVEDTETDPIFVPFRDLARRSGIRAVHSTPLITRDGSIIGVLSTQFRTVHRPSPRELHLVDLCARQAVDFIENARLYSQLAAADRSKNEFLAVLAHELRNPLAPIRNATEILQLAQPPTPESQTALEIIERQMGQMTRLIDDLLDIARITGNKLELRRQPVEIAQILRVAVETSRPLIDARGQELVVNGPVDGGIVDGDLTRLAQVVSNLLNNASKFTPSGGRIQISASRQGSDAVFTVRDSGIGIARTALPRIFDMFAQGDHGTERAQGLGIGLTLVKRLTEMHGGSVRAHSDGIGTGSEFEVRIPMLVEQPTEGSGAARDRRRVAPTSLRILVVDDNRDSATTLQMLLRLTGNEARAVYDGISAVATAEEFRPDVMLLDIGLPGMNGHEVARKLRQESWGANLILIAMTGWSMDEDKERSEQAGFDHHLVKPVEPDALMRLLVTLSATLPRAAQGADIPIRNH
jgi:PAS domain S-box-containing protein